MALRIAPVHTTRPRLAKTLLLGVVGCMPAMTAQTEVCEQACPPGMQDEDCDPTTDCVECIAGTFAPGGVFPESYCEPCPAGTTDHDDSTETPCSECLAGFYAVAQQTGECISCASGRFDSNSSQSPCEVCPPRLYSGTAATECQTEYEYFACPDKARQISNSDLIEETCKNPDGSFLPQNELPSQCVGCSCKTGYYDAAAFEIICWSFDMKLDGADPVPERDLLNDASTHDMAAHRKFEAADKSNWASTCVSCPACVDCSLGGARHQVRIKEGFGFAFPGASRIQRGTKVLDVFKCPLSESCLGDLSIADVLDNESRACAAGYASASSVPFCAVCLDNYAMDKDECSRCDAFRSSTTPVLVVMAGALVIGVTGTIRSRFYPDQLKTTAALLRLLWPRLTQSARLVITNFQILSGLPQRIRIPFPPRITALLDAMAAMMNFEIMTLPGLACIIGNNFYVKFFADMVMPAVLCILAHHLSKLHIKYLQTRLMPFPKHLDIDLDSVGQLGSRQRRRIVHQTIMFKVCRAVVASKVRAPYYSFICFIVYLRFPALSRLVFDMFRCRSVSPDMSLLEADYERSCFDTEHQIFSWIGVFFLCAYTLGIPVYILVILTRYKTTIMGRAESEDYTPAKGKKGTQDYVPSVGEAAIPGNPDFVGIAHYRPLFQFYKPECFRFEVYFWMEKVALVGFTEMIGRFVGDSTGITQWLLNMFTTLSFLILIAMYLPTTTPQYNAAYLIMHVIIIYFYIISLLLNPRVNLQDSAINNIEWIDASLVVTQCGLLMFMLFVSFVKVRDLWEQAKVQVAAERAAEALMKEKTQHFQQLRRHFSDEVATVLTRVHLSDVSGDASLVGQSIASVEQMRDTDFDSLVANPLKEQSGELHHKSANLRLTSTQDV